MTTALFEASRKALLEPNMRQAYPAAKAHLGLIASGDRFVSNAMEANDLHTALQAAGHEALAVEMQGAAVAQARCD